MHLDPVVIEHEEHQTLPSIQPKANIIFEQIVKEIKWHCGLRPDLADELRTRPLVKENPHLSKTWMVVDGPLGVHRTQSCDETSVSQTLLKGAVVQEVRLVGDRMQYKLMSGYGPNLGWITAGEALKRVSRCTECDRIIFCGPSGEENPRCALHRAYQRTEAATPERQKRLGKGYRGSIRNKDPRTRRNPHELNDMRFQNPDAWIRRPAQTMKHSTAPPVSSSGLSPSLPSGGMIMSSAESGTAKALRAQLSPLAGQTLPLPPPDILASFGGWDAYVHMAEELGIRIVLPEDE